jgi:hypothetical protein
MEQLLAAGGCQSKLKIRGADRGLPWQALFRHRFVFLSDLRSSHVAVRPVTGPAKADFEKFRDS